MTKSELIAYLAEQNPHLYQRDVERIVTTVFDEITSALSRGDRVELRGFGAFSIKALIRTEHMVIQRFQKPYASNGFQLSFAQKYKKRKTLRKQWFGSALLLKPMSA